MRPSIWLIEARARDAVRQRLLARPVKSIEELVADCCEGSDKKSAATQLLTKLGHALGVEPGRLRPEDVLGELLRVNKDELDLAALEAAWRGAGLEDAIEVFGYDIMHLVEKISTRGKWKDQRQQLRPRPADEEEWIDRIMAMKLRDFLLFFAATA